MDEKVHIYKCMYMHVHAYHTLKIISLSLFVCHIFWMFAYSMIFYFMNVFANCMSNMK